jgi:hypothetical protein
MGTTPELPVEAETLQKPAEKTTMEEETNKFTNLQMRDESPSLHDAGSAHMPKKLANGKELGKPTQEEEESVRDGMVRDTAE